MFCAKFFFRKKVVRRVRRLNPLTNTRAMLRLNPYAAVLKRQAILAAEKRKLAREEELAKKRGVSCFFYQQTMSVQHVFPYRLSYLRKVPL